MKTNYWFNRNRFLSHLRTAMPGRRAPLRRGFVLTALVFALAGLALSPQARAVCQQGCNPSNGSTVLGDDALVNSLGPYNTAIGSSALYGNYDGESNTAVGFEALYRNNGSSNTAIGSSALFSNDSGGSNTAIGSQALFSNTTGNWNTATGLQALLRNTTGSANAASGAFALISNTTGNSNTADGYAALYSNTTGFQNTANGFNALLHNTTGYRNMANGYQALFSNTIGTSNTAEGFQALYHNTGSNNIGLGSSAGINLTTGGGNVCIGQDVLGVAGESNTTRIRNVYSSVASARAVYVNSDNKIGTLVSSRRFKNEIKPMDKASEAILALKPVTFRYKKEIEPNGAVMFGLIAEEVEKVDPELVTRNDKGEVEAVRYEAVNAMLLNEFLKEHRKIEGLEVTVAQQRKDFDATIAQQQKDFQTTAAQQWKKFESKLTHQQNQIETLTAGLQKVSAQLEASKPEPQMVLNNP
jgi:hypothetical protein